VALTRNKTARNAILSRLGQSHHRAHTTLSGPPATQEAPDCNPADLQTELIEKLSINRAVVKPVTRDNWAQTLCQLAEEKFLRRWLLPDNAEGQTLAAQLNALPDTRADRYDTPFETRKDDLFNHIDAGFTRAQAAIAQTGSLLITPDSEAPRALSLIPPNHVVLLDCNDIYANFSTLIQSDEWPFRNHEPSGLQLPPANVLLISGPSKTADIQQTLAYGAHGPKSVTVLLMMDPF